MRDSLFILLGKLGNRFNWSLSSPHADFPPTLPSPFILKEVSYFEDLRRNVDTGDAFRTNVSQSKLAATLKTHL
jgi:hypothetical protein